MRQGDFEAGGNVCMARSPRDLVTLALLCLVVIASGADMVSDLGHGAPTAHLMQEGALVALAVGLVTWIAVDLHRQGRQLERLRYELAEAREAAHRRPPDLESARAQLGAAIDTQFRAWGLTTSEREVGLALLKGLSIKEIAAMRETHEKTVRQQASAIYRKADLPGRHAFVAWFIEDLL